MARFGKGRILVDLGERFAFLQHPLKTEEMAVDALAVSCPGSVLDVPMNSTIEESGTVCVLIRIMSKLNCKIDTCKENDLQSDQGPT